MIDIAVSRRSFLRGKRIGASDAISPPWATHEFYNLCERCDDCVKACEENILIRSDGGFPAVDFKKGGCTLCGACKASCKHDVLTAEISFPKNLKANINKQCLSAQSIVCRACSDICDERAIRFRLQVGGRATPSLDQELCNGCGFCISVCPVSAITMEKTL